MLPLDDSLRLRRRLFTVADSSLELTEFVFSAAGMGFVRLLHGGSFSSVFKVRLLESLLLFKTGSDSRFDLPDGGDIGRFVALGFDSKSKTTGTNLCFGCARPFVDFLLVVSLTSSGKLFFLFDSSVTTDWSPVRCSASFTASDTSVLLYSAFGFFSAVSFSVFSDALPSTAFSFCFFSCFSFIISAKVFTCSHASAF